MCGFVGIVHFNQDNPEKFKKEVREMNAIIHHRGPDSEGYYRNAAVDFGFRRLSILDLKFGSQPMSYLDERYWIIFNGEIYNEDIYRKELEAEGVIFKTTTDTEVILAMYHKYKEKTPELLRGMFSFLIWDTKEEIVFGARDQFGIKPLYFFEDNNDYYFASENKSIERIMKDKVINSRSLQQYFTFQYVPSPHQLIDGIDAIPPGTYFTIKKGSNAQFVKYYTPKFKPQDIEEAKLAKEIKESLYESVKAHMRSDVPLGSFLSGGVDSSIIVSLAKEFHPDIQTFSVGFAREGYNEIDVAKETAAKLGVQNHSRIITADDFINEFDDYVWYMDDPLADPAAVAQYFLAQETAKKCKVTLSGEGADELYGGYLIYHEPISLAMFDKYPKTVNRMINGIARSLPKKVKGRNFLLRGTTPIEERFVGNANIYKEEEKKAFLKKFHSDQSYMDITGSIYQNNQHLDDTTRMQDIDMQTWLVDDLLHNADRTTMASSLELRTPFLDKEVFAVASKIPTSLKFKNGTSKYLLRKAAEDFVPEHVLYRKKLGFPVPIRFWLKDELYEWAQGIFMNSNAVDFIDKEYTLNLLEAHRQGVADYSRKIWTLLTFVRWYDLHLLDIKK